MSNSELSKNPIEIMHEKASTISSNEHIGRICKMSADLIKTMMTEDANDNEKLQENVRSVLAEQRLASDNYRDLHSLFNSLAKSLEECIGEIAMKEKKRNSNTTMNDERVFEHDEASDHDGVEEGSRSDLENVRSKNNDRASKKKPKRKPGYCKLCDKWFGTHKDLKVHNRRHNDNVEERLPYPCDKCEKRFATPSNLKDHNNVHHLDDNDPKKLKYHCKVCGKVNNTSSSLKNHMLKHKGTDEERLPFKCNHCDRRFSQKPNMERHQLSHLPEDHPKKQKYECDICGKHFTLPYSLKGHIKSRHDKNSMPLECTDCDKRFNFQCQLENHRRTHLQNGKKNKPFKCDECDKRYSQMSDLYKHKRTHLPDYAPGRFPCKLCGKIYSKCGLSYHMKAHLPDPPKKFSCEICRNKYVTKAALEDHKRKHLEKEEDRFPFKCDVCDLKFSSMMYRNRHKKIHLGIEYKCEICGKVFNLQAALNKHKLIHNVSETWQCDVCEKKFKRLIGLEYHKKRYANNECKIEAEKERPFHCNICGTKFTVIGNLKKHMGRQHGVAKSVGKKSAAGKVGLKRKSSSSESEQCEEESDDDDNDDNHDDDEKAYGSSDDEDNDEAEE